MDRLEARQGLLSSLPMTVLMVLIFVAPLVVIAVFSIMPQRVFTFAHSPTFEAYRVFVEQGYWRSLAWSLAMAALATAILFLVCYPLAHAMTRVFGRFSLVIVIAIVLTLIVSENIRLYGWVLTLMKGGLIGGYVQSWTGIVLEGWTYNTPIIVFGLVYVYLPFMLFPLLQGLAMIPEEVRQAASDLGASRWRILWEIDLPLAMPGIVVGCLLTFVLAAGAIAESKLLGGRAVIVIADEIERAFTYGQNWPLGSALSVSLIAIIGALAFVALSRIDLDGIMGRR